LDERRELLDGVLVTGVPAAALVGEFAEKVGKSVARLFEGEGQLG
jgi:hypothetical protein